MKNARRLDRLTTRKTARQGVFRRLLSLFKLKKNNDIDGNHDIS